MPSPDDVVGATKWCVFKSIDPTEDVVRAAVQERLDRMKSSRVDILQVSPFQPSARRPSFSSFSQFHWHYYSDKRYLKALGTLRDLQDEGIITSIGLCNFDSIRTDEICTYLGPGVIISNQVQVRHHLSITATTHPVYFLVFAYRSKAAPWNVRGLRKT